MGVLGFSNSSPLDMSAVGDCSWNIERRVSQPAGWRRGDASGAAQGEAEAGSGNRQCRVSRLVALRGAAEHVWEKWALLWRRKQSVQLIKAEAVDAGRQLSEGKLMLS